MPVQTAKMKTTFVYEQRQILLLLEAYRRDLTMFSKLLEQTPKDWTLTVITDESGQRSLVVNVPPKKK